MAHIAIIIIGGLIGSMLLIGHTIINPLETFASIPVWSYPVCIFMLVGGLLSGTNKSL